MDINQKTNLWVITIASIYGWQFHPGNRATGRPLTKTLEECAEYTDKILDQVETRRLKWQQAGSQEQ